MQKQQYWILYLGLLSIVTVTTLGLAIKKRLDLPRGENNLYTLPDLPYSYKALEPYIDEETMKLHHDKHHQKYIDELNSALKGYPELQKKPLEELLTHLDAIPEAIRTKVRNNGGGHLNHSMFWLIMSPEGSCEPKDTKLKKDIINEFGSFKNFVTLFDEEAKKRFGSGWVWLCVDPENNNKLIITSTANQGTPISAGLIPLLCLDVWEHAYYLKYQNRRPDYINAWWHVVNWPYIEENYKKVLATK
jgi:superoxide dismutase, Fe-Mn family